MEPKERLKQIMTELRVKQVAFAEAIGTTQATLSRQLSGTHKIDRQAALAIQAVYGASAEWLLTGEGEMFLDGRNIEITSDRGEESRSPDESSRVPFNALPDQRLREIISILEDNPELIGVTRGLLSGTATVKELVETIELLPENKRRVALIQIRALEGC